jgi:hypothetical protein
MVTPRSRRGATLFELVAAMPIVALLALAVGLLVLYAQRTSHHVDGHTTRSREMRNAAATIASALRPAGSGDLVAWNDTLLELDATVGVAFVCGQPATSRIDLVPAHATSPLRATWSSAPDAGDDAHIVLEPDHPTDPPLPHRASITSLGTSSTGCSTSPLHDPATGPVQRLTLSGETPSTVRIGSLVRITRRTRLSLYRSGDAEWYLGMRNRTTTGWEAIQPVAGPFLAAAAGGLRFTVRARDGKALAARTASTPPDTSSAGAPASVDLLLRAASPWLLRNGRRESDSMLTTIVLRNR